MAGDNNQIVGRTLENNQMNQMTNGQSQSFQVSKG